MYIVVSRLVYCYLHQDIHSSQAIICIVCNVTCSNGYWVLFSSKSTGVTKIIIIYYSQSGMFIH